MTARWISPRSRRAFSPGRPRCPAYSKCVSSRHFEAAATGTCQILVRGRYNDILQADEHYIALDPELGNACAAVERFRDPAERRRIADAAYALVHDAHTYRHRLAALHDMLSYAPARFASLASNVRHWRFSSIRAARPHELEARLWGMIATLRHRGPDDEGVWTEAGPASPMPGCRSSTRRRPAISRWRAPTGRCGSATMARSTISRRSGRSSSARLSVPQPQRHRGHRQRLACLGARIFSRLRGMFALAIWDRRSRRLILARDRIGKKPLYYAPTAERFYSAPRSRRCWPGQGCRASRICRRSTAISPGLCAGAGDRFRRDPQAAGCSLSGRRGARRRLREPEPSAIGACRSRAA